MYTNIEFCIKLVLSFVQRIVKIFDVVDRFLRKLFLFFRNNFLYFRLDRSEKQGVINLSSYSSNIYSAVVLSDSKIAFLEQITDVPESHISSVQTLYIKMRWKCLVWLTV